MHSISTSTTVLVGIGARERTATAVRAHCWHTSERTGPVTDISIAYRESWVSWSRMNMTHLHIPRVLFEYRGWSPAVERCRSHLKCFSGAPAAGERCTGRLQRAAKPVDKLHGTGKLQHELIRGLECTPWPRHTRRAHARVYALVLAYSAAYYFRTKQSRAFFSALPCRLWLARATPG